MIGRSSLARLRIIAWISLIPFVAVTARLVWLQVIRADEMRLRADSQHVQRVWIPPERGRILDRNGEALAYTVEVDETDPANPHPGQRRVYPLGESVAHVVGYLNQERRGRGGIEKEYDDLLRGSPGWSTELRDARGRSYKALGRRQKDAIPGHDVVLTLDGALQDVAMSELDAAARALDAKGGALVALDPRTGEVLAMVSWPSFDPERVRSAAQDALRNRAVVDPYEPGSTFKLVPATAALVDGLLEPGTSIHCENGSHDFGGYRIEDHHPYGTLSFRRAFAVSSNIAFAKIGILCGTRSYDMARAYGFGTPTGIGLPGEAAGLVRRPADWSGRTAATLAIGYEVMATPLQIAAAYASIANDGVLVRPTLVKAILDPRGRVVHQPSAEPIRRVVEPDVARTLRAFLRDVIQDGTGKEGSLDWVEVGGKTGTTEKLIDGRYSKSRHYASFVGMAPIDDPRLVCLVMLDEPKRSIFGGSASAPVFRRVLEAAGRLPGAWLGPEFAQVVVDRDASGPSLLAPPDVFARIEHSTPGTASPASGLPDVRGESLRQALLVLRPYGVSVSVRGSGVVVRQSPSPGSDPGRVELVCSRSGGKSVVLASNSAGTREEGVRGRTASSRP